MADPQPSGKFANPWEHPDFGKGASELDSKHLAEDHPCPSETKPNQPTGKFTLPIVLFDRKPNHQVSHKRGDLVIDLFYDKHYQVIRVELSGTVDQLMRSIRSE